MAWASALSGKPLGTTSLRGKVDGEVVVSHQFDGRTAPQFDAKLHLEGGRLEDARLPQPLTDLTCGVHCNNALLEVHQLRGTCGSASVGTAL